MRCGRVLLLLLPLSLQAPALRPARGGGVSAGQGSQQGSGPVFIQEPANKVDFSNSSGVTVLCAAHGDPPPTLSWLLDDGSVAADVPRLRRMLHNGSLHLPAFAADEYRADVHATSYRCRASSSAGTILSRRVRLRAVVRQHYEVQVYDEFVILGNTAVLRCHVPSFVREYVTVTGWVRGGDQRILGDADTGGRYSVFPTGELHIREARAEDGAASYRCETRHRLTGETRLSSVSGRVVVAPPQSSVPPRVTDSRSVVSGRVKDSLELPCAAQGSPAPEYR
ncbi:Down syndrome cell adhesion molecule-like protein Dscam2 [Thrips palmi]|uniref:Down syndrome cell adhesion molecule-like protein Dscam2 n=1 Tax=Thrips palmi TaxID=161013 RepID=A0A6P9A4Q0_THRPL|nr:Down syndrome cell adhesion molecule-like protein Dscam2 [Thrips palmi]